jgi:gamma-glutamyltranspeptidase / glutathione hydrolase
MLESGGNAIDAAVAANAAMGVVAPMMSGIGGDLFAIVYHAKTKQVYGLNASGWAPKALPPSSSSGRTRGPQLGELSAQPSQPLPARARDPR